MARSVMICRTMRIANNGLGGRNHTTAIMTAKISTPMMMFFTVDFMTILFLIVTILGFCKTMEWWAGLLQRHSRFLLNPAGEGV